MFVGPSPSCFATTTSPSPAELADLSLLELRRLADRRYWDNTVQQALRCREALVAACLARLDKKD